MFWNRPCHTTYFVHQRDSYQLNSCIKTMFLSEMEFSNSCHYFPIIPFWNAWSLGHDRRPVANVKWKPNNAIYDTLSFEHTVHKRYISQTRANLKFGFIALIWISFHLQVVVVVSLISNRIKQWNSNTFYILVNTLQLRCILLVVTRVLIIGIDIKFEVIVVSAMTWEAHHSPRAKPEACGELSRSLVTP